MTTFAVSFLGCKVSLADAEVIRGALIAAGHAERPAAEAEVHVVNTCAVTVEAEKKSRKVVSRSARAGARTFVSGCAAGLNGGQFASPGVAVVARDPDRAAAEILEVLGTGPACGRDRVPAALGDRTRAFLKVQDGCDNACAFCVIRVARGPGRSVPAARLVADAARRVAAGTPEITVTGISVGGYRDPEAGLGLGGLVERLAGVPGLRRLRISSIEPDDLTDGLIATLAGGGVVAPHLHVPLQSGDPGVLRAMRRHHTDAEWLAGVERARARVPGLNLTTDVIVGFPGEDEDAFARTCALVEGAGVTKVHVFPYSARPGTPAAGMAGRVAPEVVRERAGRLRDLSDRLGARHRRARVGSRDRVLVERVLDDGTRTGYGADYSRFLLPPGPEGPGGMVDVVAAASAGGHLEGRPA
ncbi:MAG: MiaB/RimO family radical SAM methylthiotransferase [Thermoleophilia bacterium]|nr:MiaB/RimO family radical SAM methylthiotransferase [Thermoleophilia bacterium]